jgi:hypothetical protein
MRHTRLMLNYCYLLTRPLRFVLSTRAAKAGSSRRTTLTGVLLLSVALTDVSKAAELKDINNYKLYAHSRVGDFKQFICLEKAWTQESNWNPKAVGNKQGTSESMEYHKSRMKRLEL